MNSRERVLSTFDRKGYDRIPIKHEGTPEITQMIMDHFGLKNFEQVLTVVGDDFRYAEAVYCGPELKKFPDGSQEGYFGERYNYVKFEGGQYLESVYQPYADINDLDKLDRSHFPKADWFDYSTIKQQCERIRKTHAVCYGTAGDLDFINSIARARGTQEVLIDLIDDNPVFLEIMKARFEFYYNQHEKALQAADGLIDFVHVGEDFGTQRGPTISMDIFEKHFAPKYEKYFKMAHSYGARTLMHMCGTIKALLQKEFGDKLTFCGSLCVQSTIAFGTTEDVEKQVKRRLELFPDGGLFLGPTHAIQVGSPIENIIALYKTAGSLTEKIDDKILSIEDPTGTEIKDIKISKCF